eukprot:3371058-Amphidinium_carterae.1
MEKCIAHGCILCRLYWYFLLRAFQCSLCFARPCEVVGGKQGSGYQPPQKRPSQIIGVPLRSIPQEASPIV